MLQKRRLGNTDIEIAAIAYGCMGHELSAYYDITHGLGLAAQFGRNVMGIPATEDVMADAKAAIDALADFCYNTLGLESHLANLGIGEENFEKMAEGRKMRKKRAYLLYSLLNTSLCVGYEYKKTRFRSIDWIKIKQFSFYIHKTQDFLGAVLHLVCQSMDIIPKNYFV